MAIRDTILTLKNKEETLSGNKVCNFAYDDTAYADDTTAGANGVTTYNYNNHNNIPVKDNTVIKVNPTITAKGFRSQVSTLPRMLLNHIFGRVSYNLNKTVDTLNALLTALYGAIGQANGLATLDNTGRIPYSQLPLSAVEYKGAWNANTNTPTLSAGTGTFGDEYIISAQGTRNLGEGSITYRVGDRIIYNGSIWQRIPSSSVRTVNTKTPDANGNVTVNAGDIVTPDVYGRDRTTQGKVWTQGSGGIVGSSIVKYANGMWVRAGTGSKATPSWSTDGKTWHTATTFTGAQQIFNDIEYANGLWVLAGGNAYWSTDGKNWTEETSGGGFCVKFWAGIWLMGSKWSVDGKSWTNGNFPSGFRDVVEITYGNGIWVAADGSNGYIAWSTDGKNWTSGTGLGSGDCVYHVHYANGMFVSSGQPTNVGTGNVFYWSTDGKNWTAGTAPSNAYWTEAISYADGIWVTGGQLFWSTDGKNWTEGTRPARLGGLPQRPVFANNLWVVPVSGIDQTLGILWSSNGKSWSWATGIPISQGISCVDYGNNIWVGVGINYTSGYYSEGNLTNNVKTILDWLLYAVDNLLD